MIRVQLRRGHSLPDLVRYVGRPSRWGNPFMVLPSDEPTEPGWDVVYVHRNSAGFRGMNVVATLATRDEAIRSAIAHYADYAENKAGADPTWLDPLRDSIGLACYCKPGEPCHADVLVEMLSVSAASRP